jgi:pimeloyl-ACP methyl ester carboxylesterase
VFTNASSNTSSFTTPATGGAYLPAASPACPVAAASPSDRFEPTPAVPDPPRQTLSSAIAAAWQRATSTDGGDSSQEPATAALFHHHPNSHIPSSVPPTLSRPVLFVPGYNSKRAIYEYVVEYLKQANPDGGTYDTTKPPQVDPAGRLFVLKFDKPWHSAADNTKQLREAIESICKATGSSKIDLVTHSMGALDARLYMDQGGDKIGKLLMVSPPNHGSRLADDDLWFRETYNIPTYPPTRDPDVLLALADLRCDATPDPAHHRTGNPFLNELNAHWDDQKARLEAVDIMAGGGLPTREVDGSITTQGDGIVTWSSTAMPGLAPHVYSGQVTDNHARVLNDTRLISDIGTFLAGGTISQASEQA